MKLTPPNIPEDFDVVPPHQGENASDFYEIHDCYGRTATVYGEPSEPETQRTAQFLGASWGLAEALADIIHDLSRHDPDVSICIYDAKRALTAAGYVIE